MTTRALLLGLLLACGSVVTSRAEQSPRFELDVPSHVDTRPTYLVLRDVEVAKHVGVVFRAYALRPDSGKVLLGSTAVPGVAPDAQGVTTLAELRINATTGLRRWLATAGSARKVSVEITAASGGDSTAKSAEWRVKSAEFVQPQ